MNRSTYYDQQSRPISNTALRRALLSDVVTKVHAESRATYGVRRVAASLRIDEGLIVNHKLVRRIMRELGLHGLPKRRSRRYWPANAATQDDLVNRVFSAATPNRLWLTDVTEHPTRESILYCCAVLDMCSRKVVGWSIDRRNDADLVTSALSMAAGTRQMTPGETICHSDHGSPYVSWAFTEKLRHHALLGSMGTVGDSFDNAPMESFWGSLQIEVLDRQRWLTFVELAHAIADYIVNFYNPRRRHSSLDYLTPDEFEGLWFPHQSAPTVASLVH
jgi:putative transposase